MLDRLQFLISRGLGPISNFGILTAIGLRFGKAGLADYTYAMVVCATMYFVVGFSLQTYIAVQPTEVAHRRDILWARLLSVGGSCALALVAALIGGPLWYVVAGVWLVKAGELLFEPVIVFAAIDVSSARRGRDLASMEIVRFLVVQLILWSTNFGLRTSLPATLATTGFGSLFVGVYYLVTYPKWTGPLYDFDEIWLRLRKIAFQCTPMAASGAILALVIGLPRLLMDHRLGQDERALMGIAQVGGSVIGLIFHAIWMYDLHKLKIACRHRKFLEILSHNLRLSMIYGLILAIASVIVLVGPDLIELKLVFVRNHAGLLSFLLGIMTLPHCISLHRDVLKLIGVAWLEVLILTASLVLGIATWYVCTYHFALDWVKVVVAILIATSIFQFAISVIVLFKMTQRPILSPWEPE